MEFVNSGQFFWFNSLQRILKYKVSVILKVCYEIVKGEWECREEKEEEEKEKLLPFLKAHSPPGKERHRVHWKSTKQRREGELYRLKSYFRIWSLGVSNQ